MIQTYVLYKYGDQVIYRLLGTLICPLIYTLFEIHELKDFILNIGHFFFWIFSIFVGILNALKIKSKKKMRLRLEFATVFMNIVIFVFVYMYFDIMLSYAEQDSQGMNEYISTLSIFNIGNDLIDFFKDPAHIYITYGGILLGGSLGISQVKVLSLKEKIHDLFGKYVATSIRDTLIENNGIYNEKRELCVLFSDIRNFTTISENAESSVLIASLNEYFSLWEATASKHGGVINKFIGDAVMIVFGLDNAKTPENGSIACALEVLNELDNLNHRLNQMSLLNFSEIGIGIHTGEMVLGNVGSENRKEFTVIGDVVNTASRLETLTKTIDEDLIISMEVFERLEASFKLHFEYFDTIKLKGKTNPMKLCKIKQLTTGEQIH